MKNKEIVVFLIIIALLTIIMTNVFATDETGDIVNETVTSENESGNNTENGEGNNNENQTNTENNEIQNNSDDNTVAEETTNPDTVDNNDNNNESHETSNNSETIVTDNQPPITSTTNDYEDDNESDNAYLKNLEVNVEGLSPEFNKNTTDYYLIVDLTVDEIEVYATKDDKKATVSIDGNDDLEEGENLITITVKAEDGTTKIYTIHVTKTDDIEGTNAYLKTLSIKGFNFYPSFKNNIYTYNLIINEMVNNLVIQAEPENAGASYEIIGNENLEEGNNIIKIKVTAANGETSKEYKINAYISSKTVSGMQTDKKQAFVLLCIIGLGILVTEFIIVKKKN